MDRIDPSDIVLGKPLKFDVVAEDGRLLLSRGQVVSHENSRLALIEKAFKVSEQERRIASQVPVFVRMERMAFRLATLETDVTNGVHSEGWVARVRAVTHDLIEATDEDPDAAFAAMHLEARYKYDVVHHMMAAVLCARLGRAAGMRKEERFSLVVAAITHDIAVLAMRAELEASTVLTPQQHERIREHPQRGVEILRELGVDDPLWLQAVLEHHEFLDGSGYAGLRGDQLGTASRIIALADAISAMLRPRPYRDRKLAKAALADLYQDGQGRYDKNLLTSLIRDLGLYPPGSVVRLANREIALAIRPRPGRPAIPEAVAITDYAGRPLERPVPRDVAEAEYHIVSLLDPDQVAKVRKTLPDCWKKS